MQSGKLSFINVSVYNCNRITALFLIDKLCVLDTLQDGIVKCTLKLMCSINDVCYYLS